MTRTPKRISPWGALTPLGKRCLVVAGLFILLALAALAIRLFHPEAP